MKDKPKKSPANADGDNEGGIWKDPRFAHLVSDPRFKNIHKSTKSVKIDNRFKSMFNDEKFKVKYTVDKYGRRVNKTSTDDLEKYYELSSEDEEDEKRKEEEELIKEATGENDALESEEEISEDIKTKLQNLSVDYARGELPLLSDSSSDDEESEDEGGELFIEHVWGELDNDAPRTEESTRRLAACNMDWDRIRAADIMVLCKSFLPPGGSILSVTIYPSEYGKERLAEEEVKGPQELTERKLQQQRNDGSTTDSSDDDDDDDLVNEKDNEEGSDYHMEKLRQYQLNRLKYFYAVIECDSVRTADKLYAECDGIEYESTATKFDLRFIPDEMTFDDEPKDKCTEVPDLARYKPRMFTTTALQQAKVELTWDENDVERMELNEKMLMGKIDDIPETELRKYVAYTSDEAETEDEADQDGELNQKPQSSHKGSGHNKKSVQNSFKEEDLDDEAESLRPGKPVKGKKDDGISKYKQLLLEINKKEEHKKSSRIEMEFSWGVGVSKKPEESKQSSKSEEPELTPFEKILEKKREKKRARKVHIKQLKKGQKGSDSEADDSSDDDIPDGIDLNDPYFAEEFANDEFEDLKAKKNKEKAKKKSSKNDEEEDNDAEAEKELALLLDDDDNKAHFSLKKIQENENQSKSRKRKMKLKLKKEAALDKQLDDDFKMDVRDDRFSALYKSHLFNIDPTDSHYKKTKGMEQLIHEKLKRKVTDHGESVGVSEPSVKKSKKNVIDSLLVKSIKRKVQQQSN